MRSINPNAPTFLDKGNKRFTALHNSLDVLFRGLQERNIGTSTSHHSYSQEMKWLGKDVTYTFKTYTTANCLQTHQQEAFYFRPKPKTPKEGPCYFSVPIGKNKLAVMVGDM